MEIRQFLIKKDCPIKEAMGVIGNTGLGIVFVVDEHEVLAGTVTDGDIRKALARGLSVNITVEQIMNQDPLILKEQFNLEEIKAKIKSRQNSFVKCYSLKIPVLDEESKVKNIVIYSVGSESYQLLNQNKSLMKEDVKKVLVVGGAGYIGSILCRKFLERGYQVRVMDTLVFGEEPILSLLRSPAFELIKGDMRDITKVTAALDGVDAVVLLAGIVGDPASSQVPKETIETNYFATMTLAWACKYYQINRFIFASTCSVYGANENVVTEDDSLNPLSLYARSKIDSEREILALKDDNFSPTMLRMATVYGLSPRMRFDLVINVFALKAATSGKIAIFGGDQWRPFVHVEDAAEAYVQCLESPLNKVAGQIFNVGGENLTINQVGEIVKEHFPRLEIERSEKEIIKGAMDARNYRVSFEKMEKELGFKHKRTVQQAVMEMKEALEKGNFTDFEESRYYNVEMAKKVNF